MKSNPMILSEYFSKGGNKSFGTLITAVSYEVRSYATILSILENFNITDVLLIIFSTSYLSEEYIQKWNTQKNKLSNLFKEHDIEVNPIRCNPTFFHSSIKEITEHVNNDLPCIVNMNSFPKNYLLRLQKEFDDINNAYIYTPSEYREPSTDERCIGIERIIPIDGFEGSRELDVEDLLIIILGYEENRAISFLSSFSSNRILPIISIPNIGNPIQDERFKESVIKCNGSLLRKHRVLKADDNTYYSISSIDHIKFFHTLEAIYLKYKEQDFDICISPIGTKAQTIGLYLFWREHQNVQLLYSVPVRRHDMTITQSKNYDMHKSENNSNIHLPQMPFVYNLPNSLR